MVQQKGGNGHPAFLYCAVIFSGAKGAARSLLPRWGCARNGVDPACEWVTGRVLFVGGRPLSLRGNKFESGVSWRKIKAEYIAGGISQRKLAEKYDINPNLLMRHANKEKWNAKRKAAERKALEKVEQKTAEKVADNAVLLQDIKTKLLQKLSAMVDAYPDANAAEVKHRTKNTEIVYRMRDIAAVYAALEDKTFKANIDIEDLSPLGELLKDD